MSFKSGIAFSFVAQLLSRRGDFRIRRRGIPTIGVTSVKFPTFLFLRALSHVFLYISFPLPCTLACLTHLVKHAYILNQRRRVGQNLRGIIHSGAFIVFLMITSERMMSRTMDGWGNGAVRILCNAFLFLTYIEVNAISHLNFPFFPFLIGVSPPRFRSPFFLFPCLFLFSQTYGGPVRLMLHPQNGVNFYHMITQKLGI